MEGSSLATAVEQVLPATGLHPAGFEPSALFLQRARNGEEAVTAVNGRQRLLAFAGDGPTSEEVAAEKAARALASLDNDVARTLCEHIVVVWAATDQAGFNAAVFSTQGGQVDQLEGLSWLAPQEWPRPTIDVTLDAAADLEQTLGRIADLVRERRSKGDFLEALDRETGLVDDHLARAGGTSQDARSRPAPDAPEQAWLDWLSRYRTSVGNEWARVAGGQPPSTLEVHQPAVGGSLAGMRVFLSYAMPDQASLALPVREALGRCGATVWFDRERPLGEEELRRGLADAIAECDAFVMCASREYLANAGYAAQELAWLLAGSPTRSRLQRRAIVARTEVALPSALSGWPLVRLREQEQQVLEQELASALEGDPGPVTLPTSKVAAPRRIELAAEADVAVLRSRVAHLQRFEQLPHDVYAVLVGKITVDDTDPRAAAVQAMLDGCGEGLGWSGTLSDLDDWPTDPAIRDLRWRLGTVRAVCAVQAPPHTDPESLDAVAAEVERLVRMPVPMLRWQSDVGWDDDERRFALRSHQDSLHMLKQIVNRGSSPVLDRVPLATLEDWLARIDERSVECFDALIELRLAGRLTWHSTPQSWDAFFRAWSRVFSAPPEEWHAGVPGWILMMLLGSAEDVAAAAAQAAWCGARFGGRWSQRVPIGPAARSRPLAVCARTDSADATECPDGGAALTLGIDADGKRVVTFAWAGWDEGTGGGADGSVAAAAPAELAQAFSFFST
jgi:hypothetical protein